MPSIVVASQELGRTPNYGDLFLERLFHSFSVARDFSVIENCWHRHGAVYLVNGGFFAGWAISRCLIVNPSHSKWSQKAFLFYIQLNSHGDVNRLKGVTDCQKAIRFYIELKNTFSFIVVFLSLRPITSVFDGNKPMLNPMTVSSTLEC